MASIKVDQASFLVSDRGSGTPLVLLHGFPLDHRMWEAQVAALSDRFRVIAPDLRGFGQSRSQEPFTIESLADDVHALLEQMNALPCLLAGLSMGGYVALAYAKKYPGDLRGLILIDTKADADSAEAKEGRQKMIELVQKSGSSAVADQMLPKMLTKDAPAARPQTASELRKLIESCPPKTIENALAAMRDRPDRTGELSSIKVPTLILVGDGDVLTPPAVAQAMQEKIPQAQLITIQGAGHMSPMEQPEQVNRAIRQFVEGIEQRP